jgi:hypothetical protein
MTHEIGTRNFREATPEEQQRHSAIREKIQEELPELKRWAKETAVRHRERLAVGTVFTDQEAAVLEAIDNSAAKHSLLPSRTGAAARGGRVAEAIRALLA